MTMLRSVLVFSLLLFIKYVSKVFYRHDFGWVGENVPEKPWDGIRLTAFLNHTSLFELIFLGGVPNSFIWRIAAHGVVPAADKTTSRPLVGILYKLVAHSVIPVTRERDNTWFAVLQKIDPDSMVLLAPEGRMKRPTGLDLQGNPMTVRGGIADILLAIKEGRFLIGYSGGLHHVQAPGGAPRIFKTVRMRIENLDIAEYIAGLMAKGGPDEFKRNVREDLERRRDFYCPEEDKIARVA